MKNFKKFPIFFTVLIALIVVFVAGIGYDFYLSTVNGRSVKGLKSAINSYQRALKDDPTVAAIDASNANIEALKKHLTDLEKDLTRASDDIFVPLNGKDGYQLQSTLQEKVPTWRKTATQKGILLDEDMDFGYSKYVKPGADAPKDVAVASIWKQACVLDYINKKLFASKAEESPMYILSVQRELLPTEIEKADPRKKKRVLFRGKSSSLLKGDNFEIDKAITARKAGSIETIAYKFVFAGHTDVLRRFLNQLKNFDAMLVVRSIGVKPISNSELSKYAPKAEDKFGQSNSNDGLDSLFGGAEAAASTEADANQLTAEQREPVVTDNISEFTVIIEYVELVKPAPEKTEADDETKE